MLAKIWSHINTLLFKKQRRTIRYAFPVTLVVASLLIGAAVVQIEKPYMIIEAHPTTVKEGDRFFIDVSINTKTGINAIDVALSYSESQMKITGFDTGQSVITLWTEEPYAKGGKIYLSGGTFRRGFIGEHLVVRVRAEAIESGAAYVSTDAVRFIAGDGLGTEVAPGKINQKTRVYITNADGVLVGEASIHIVTDIDGDGEVDFADIQAFMQAWRNKSRIFDFNGDNKMTIVDFAILLADSFFK